MSELANPINLKVQNLTKKYSGRSVVSGLSFQVREGEVVGLLGPNGAGKTTAFYMTIGLIQPESGRVFFKNQDVTESPIHKRARLGMGYLAQEPSIFRHLTVEENICLGDEPRKMGLVDREAMRKRAVQALQYFEHPEIKPDLKVNDLSVSAQQLVEIARALALGCKILVFDEPTSSLSTSDAKRLFEVIGMLKKQGISIVYISHFLEEVKAIADRLTVLRDGKVIGTHDVSEVSTDDIVKMMVGRNIHDLYPHAKRIKGEEILNVRQLAGMKMPKDVSLKINKGEVVGIFGLVGAGRTEFFRSLFGLDPVQKGQIKIALYSGPARPRERWKQGIGMMSENRKEEGLVKGMSIADNITMSKLKGFGPLGFISPKNQRRSVRRWIENLDIRCHGPEQSIDDLSGGNQQKAIFARLLQHDVDLFLLDEPTRGIDVGSKAKIYEAINHLAVDVDDKGLPRKAVLVVSSYMPELLGICDRIAVMHKGRLSALKKVDELNDQILMAAATGQTALG